MKNHSKTTGWAPNGTKIVRSRSSRSASALTVALVVILALAAGGAAYAGFSGTGLGTGSASTGSMQAVTITALTGGDQPSTSLVPGGSADVVVRVVNPNESPVQVFSVTADGGVTADPAHSGCTSPAVTFTAPAAPISPAVTVPGSSSVSFHLPGAASMGLSSQSACQGATFEIPVTLTARQ